MTDQELAEINQKVAEKVMGLQVCKCDHKALRQAHYEAWMKRREDPYADHNDYGYFSHGSDKKCNHCNKLYMPVIHYTSDMNHAWEVVEKLQKDGLGVSVYVFNKETRARIWEENEDGSTTPIYQFIAPSAPLAICLAALISIEGKEQPEQ